MYAEDTRTEKIGKEAKVARSRLCVGQTNMPELPEVETIVRGLQREVIGRTITDLWCERPQTIKTHTIAELADTIRGLTITDARRRAKYILIDLAGGKTLAIHQKMSGHLLYGRWHQQKPSTTQTPETASSKPSTDTQWTPILPDLAYHDPYNRFIRCIFFLDDGSMLGLSDVRRFAKIYLGDTNNLEAMHDFAKIGPEPLDPALTAEQFTSIFAKHKGPIKKLLMDPHLIAGIGNIYADEILWHSDIHPLRSANEISPDEYQTMLTNTRLVLERAIEAKGHSEMNYRMLNGEKGSYQTIACAYQLDGKPCQRQDGGIIEKIRINNRSAHFCPIHQH